MCSTCGVIYFGITTRCLNRNQNIRPALVRPKGKESQMPVKPQSNTNPKR